MIRSKAEDSLDVVADMVRTLGSSRLRRIMHSSEGEEVKLFGYQHNHGVGARSLHIVISLSTCAAQPAAIISRKNENVHLVLPVDCQDSELQKKVVEFLLPEIVGHPNVASALLVGAGCEVIPVRQIMQHILGRNTALEFIVAGESNRMSTTKLFGEGALSELSAKSMPGFDFFTGSKVGIIHRSANGQVTEVVAGLEEMGIRAIAFEGEGAPAITQLVVQGCVAIVNFLNDEELPSSSAIVPVISISSGSSYHSELSELCDLDAGASTAEILSTIRATLGRQMTKAETLRMIAPLDLEVVVEGVR